MNECIGQPSPSNERYPTVLKLPPLDARIPKWNLDNLIERNCPFCGFSDADTVYERPDGLSVRHCKRCTAFFVNPSPSDEQIRIFYKEYDSHHRRAPKIDAKELLADYNCLDPFDDLRIMELRTLMKFEDARVLDIGFGRAYFLYCMKKLGSIPYGLELDHQAIDVARFLGIENVSQGDIADYTSDKQFDLIILSDLVEHPLHPMELLGKACELLKDGGYLLIWTPNGEFTRIEEHPTALRVDLEHMQYLTPHACSYIASMLNMRIMHLETIGFPHIDGIDIPLPIKERRWSSHLKRMIKSIPGFSVFNNLRHKLSAHEKDERSGSYHLFCIMRKTVDYF